MMSSKTVSGNGNSTEDCDNVQLLHDIEMISNALYLHKFPPKALKSPSLGQSKSNKISHLIDPKLNSNTRYFREDELHIDKKSTSIWNWKKPLKALTHIWHRRFNCCFFLSVHSIEGLPMNLNGIRIRVYWKRKDEVLHTRPSQISQGIAEFDETLMHKCSVYCSRSGPDHLAKYEEKLFLVYASIMGAPRLDVGKHLVDLTRLLPLTMEELGGEKCSGKWTTSFKLTGRAKGATLNVSFGFSMMRDDIVESGGSINVHLMRNRSSAVKPGVGFRPGNSSGMLGQVGSIPNNSNKESVLSSQSVDVNICHKVLADPGLELSKSVSFLYQKFDEGNSSAESDVFSERAELFKPKSDIDFESVNMKNECDNTDFTVTERGIELSKKEQLKFEEGAVDTIDWSTIEFNVDEIIKDNDLALDQDTRFNQKDESGGSCMDEVVVDDGKCERNSLCTEVSTIEELESVFHGLLTSEPAESGSPLTTSEFLEQENCLELKSNYKESKMGKKSISLDDITESVASDFLNMLGIEHSPFHLSSDSDPESPRERLLREFEKEAQASRNFIIDFDAKRRQELGSASPTESDLGDVSEDFDVFPVIKTIEEEQERAKRNAKFLEDLETEALMQEWGLNEQAFHSSTHYHSTGFGSPIELPHEESLDLPPLGDGLGPFLQLKGGGFLRSLNPSIFRHAKYGASLIMQVSTPVVLPAVMGVDILEILECLASDGIQNFFMKANKLMPLEDITGKIQQVVREAAPRMTVLERQVLLQNKSEAVQSSVSRREELEGSTPFCSYTNMVPDSECDNNETSSVSMKDLVPLAMHKIEVLSIEGLRIQSGLSDEDAPCSISPQSNERLSPLGGKIGNLTGFLEVEGYARLQLLDDEDADSDVNGILGMSITLDEWLSLDTGIDGDKDQISKRTTMILAAHRSKCIEFGSGRLTRDITWDAPTSRKCGLLGNNLSIAHMVQLRDPLRDYEPVGTPMLAIIQVERIFVPIEPEIYSILLERKHKKEVNCDPMQLKEWINDKRKEDKNDENDVTSLFKIIEVHLVGLNTEPGKNLWGSTIQQQSGVRWLHSTGMGKTSKHPFSNSKAIVKFSRQIKSNVQPRDDCLWSISSSADDTEASRKQFMRNPDIIFSIETISS